MLRALLYAYVLGGLTFIPLLIGAVLFIAIYTSVPVDPAARTRLDEPVPQGDDEKAAAATTDSDPTHTTNSTTTTTTNTTTPSTTTSTTTGAADDAPRARKGWLTMRRTFAEPVGDGGYVTLVRAFLDARAKDARRARPRDTWFVVLKGSVLFLYEDERQRECSAAVDLRRHRVSVAPAGLPDAELFTKRNAICLAPREAEGEGMPSLTREMRMGGGGGADEGGADEGREKAPLEKAVEREKDAAREEALDASTPWFIFVRSNVEMEDWYFALIHASEQGAQTPVSAPFLPVFDPEDMHALIATLDEAPDVIPMRWLNALLGRLFLSHYRTRALEAYIVGRLMKKLGKVKMPAFLTDVAVTQVSVGRRAPMLSKPMLKELTREGDAAIEVHMHFRGEVRITVEATAVINLGARFKAYTVKLALAAVLKELEGNLLIKVKRPPSNRIWYAFTQTPRMVLEVEPIVSDRQLTWGMILSTIESKFREVIQESVVMPNMDDIAFFETGIYEHRGGIFAEACRKPRAAAADAEASASASTASTGGTPAPEEVQSVASAPLPDTISLPPLDKEKEDTPAPLARAATDVLPGTALEDAAEVLPRANSSSHSNSTSSTSSRRRSWFAAAKSEDGTAVEEAPGPSTSSEAEDDASRGRGLSPGPPTPPPRAPSTPRSTDNARALTPEPMGHARRASTSSHRSVGRESDAESLAGARSAPQTPRREGPARAASPPSFFSTLKSKAAAADTQALGNTAKEAMRKWGVGWAGFKKDAAAAGAAGGSGDEGAGAGAGLPASPPRLGEGSTLFERARTSYAEVRAAVAERKEREHESTVRARVVSTGAGAGRLPNGSVYGEAAGTPGVVSAASRLVLAAKKAVPAAGVTRVSTDGESSSAAAVTDVVVVVGPTGETPGGTVVEEVRQAPTPIHVQPVAKTMSIPGIHASHRGDVQSMGYVAPAPPPSAPAPNIYRLWKTPSGGAEAGPGPGPGEAPAAVAPAPAVVEEEQEGAPRKPTPPPLPPRAGPASEALKTIVRKDETSRDMSVPPALPPRRAA